MVHNATSMSNHATIYLSLQFCKFPNPVNLHLRQSLLLQYVLSSTWNLKDELLFNDSQIILELVLQTYPSFNDYQIILERVLLSKKLVSYYVVCIIWF
jgi:hypothetical protein